MPTSPATLSNRFRKCICGLLVMAAMPPSLAYAAASESLRRSDTLDVRRIGKVSEDERAVLRIEWRAGLSGVDTDRKVDDIMARVRAMEVSAAAVGQALRSAPANKPGPAPVPAMESAEAGENAWDWKLMAANLTALVLVSIWWISRRKSQRETEALEAQLAARQLEPVAAEAEPMPYVQGPPEQMAPIMAPDESSWPPTSTTSEPLPPIAAAEADNGAPSVASEPAVTAPDEFAPTGSAETEVPDQNASEIDFVLEEADPETVAKELARARRKSKPLKASALGNPAEQGHVEPTLQLAEIMLSMGLEQGAAQALVEYTEANPRDAIYHMLKLLGIYRRRGLHREFQETAEKLRKNFNIQAEEWNQPSGESPTLERFPRIAEHVSSIWHQPAECIDYLRHLVEDNREGARAGFPQSVAEEILLLVEIQKELAGENQPAA